MAIASTHIHFVKKEYIKNPRLFSDFDMSQVYFGAVLADIYFAKLFGEKKTSFGFRIHVGHFGMSLAKKLYSTAIDKNEASFALGFISHIILDKYIHGYLFKHNLFDVGEHIVLELFLAAEVSPERNYLIIKKFPSHFFLGTIKKYYPNDYKKYKRELRVNVLKLLLYKLSADVLVRYTLTSKYLPKSPEHNHFFDYILKRCYQASFKPYKYKINDLIYPHQSLKEKHTHKMIKEYHKAEKEFHDFMKNQGKI